jgi:hypothetical protein
MTRAFACREECSMDIDVIKSFYSIKWVAEIAPIKQKSTSSRITTHSKAE